MISTESSHILLHLLFCCLICQLANFDQSMKPVTESSRKQARSMFWALTWLISEFKSKKLNWISYTVKQFEKHAILVQHVLNMKTTSNFVLLADFITSDDLFRMKDVTAFMFKHKISAHLIIILVNYFSDRFFSEIADQTDQWSDQIDLKLIWIEIRIELELMNWINLKIDLIYKSISK